MPMSWHWVDHRTRLGTDSNQRRTNWRLSSSVSSPLGSPATLALWQMDPKFLRNLKWSKRHNGKGRGGDEE